MNIAVLSAGEMGAAIGGALLADGHHVSTLLENRGKETAARVLEQEISVAASLTGLLEEADLLLSIVPPAAAYSLAERVATAAGAAETSFTFVECNAVSPDTAKSIEALFRDQPVTFVDGGIVGSPPAENRQPRLYLSGDVSDELQATGGKAFTIRTLGGAIGSASALKLCYAAVTKGTNTLLTAALVAADRYGLLEPMAEELSASQPALYDRATANISRLPADAARWAPEMRHISEAFGAVGVPGAIHEGIALMLELLAASEYGSETRRTQDLSRSALDTVRGITPDR